METEKGGYYINSEITEMTAAHLLPQLTLYCASWGFYVHHSTATPPDKPPPCKVIPENPLSPVTKYTQAHSKMVK